MTRSEAGAPEKAGFINPVGTGELLRQLVQREIVENIKGSALGVLWLILNPLMMMMLYVVVFGVLFGGSFGKVENESPLAFAVGVYIGLTVVALINETITKSTNTISKSSNLVKKVVFPLQILPLVQVCASTFKFGVNGTLWIAAAILVGSALGPQILLLPLILTPLFMIATGIAFLVSSLSVYFRDIQHLTQFFSQIIFWSSGVFFSSVRVMEHPPLWAVLKWNPIFLTIENVRAVALWGITPNLAQLVYLYLIGVFLFLAGSFVFSRLKAGFADFL